MTQSRTILNLWLMINNRQIRCLRKHSYNPWISKNHQRANIELRRLLRTDGRLLLSLTWPRLDKEARAQWQESEVNLNANKDPSRKLVELQSASQSQLQNPLVLIRRFLSCRKNPNSPQTSISRMRVKNQLRKSQSNATKILMNFLTRKVAR